MGDGDDVAADRVGLEDVEELAGAGPDQLDWWDTAPAARTRRGHQRHRVAAGVGDPAGEHRDAADGPRPRAAETSRTCVKVISAVTFSLTPALASRRIDRGRSTRPGCWSRGSSRRRSRPSGDLAGLPLHLGELVGEDLERDRPVGDRLEDCRGERP